MYNLHYELSSSFSNMKNRHLNSILCLTLIMLNLAVGFLTNKALITQEAFYHSFSNQFEYTQIDEFYSFRQKSVWIFYILLPFILVFKIFLVSICLQTSLILNDFKLKFTSTFKIAITAEFVFLLPQLIKLAWFLLVKTEYTLTDVQQFYPLSALNLFKIENLSALLIYPFQTFNVFEILYWIILAGGIKQALDTDINHGIRVVFSGYIPALILWIICVMFITVSLSPAV